MKPRVYVETSVISYLTARPSRDPVNAARQFQAKALWNAQDRFNLLVSPVVIDEAMRGHIKSKSSRALTFATWLACSHAPK